MNNAYNVFENREYYSSGPYHSRRLGVVYKKAVPNDWMTRNRPEGAVGRIWQISPRSWGFNRLGNHFTGNTIGRARTLDEAIQKMMRVR